MYGHSSTVATHADMTGDIMIKRILEHECMSGSLFLNSCVAPARLLQAANHLEGSSNAEDSRIALYMEKMQCRHCGLVCMWTNLYCAGMDFPCFKFISTNCIFSVRFRLQRKDLKSSGISRNRRCQRHLAKN